MSENDLTKEMERVLIELAKQNDVSPSMFVSALGSAFLNLCGWICDCLGYDEEKRNTFFNELIKGFSTCIDSVKERRKNERS